MVHMLYFFLVSFASRQRSKFIYDYLFIYFGKNFAHKIIAISNLSQTLLAGLPICTTVPWQVSLPLKRIQVV